MYAMRITCNAAVVQQRITTIGYLLENPYSHLRALRPAVEKTALHARVNAPWRTGDLARNIRVVTAATAPVTVVVRTDLPYSWMRERGGDIPARRAKYLRWVNYSGQLRFAKQVTQTGTHYMKRAHEETWRTIPPAFLRNLLYHVWASAR